MHTLKEVQKEKNVLYERNFPFLIVEESVHVIALAWKPKQIHIFFN